MPLSKADLGDPQTLSAARAVAMALLKELADVDGEIAEHFRQD